MPSGDAIARTRRSERAPAGLHAPRLLNHDGSVQRSAHPLPGTLGAFLPALVHPPLLPARSGTASSPISAHTPRTVGWAVAACLAAQTARSDSSARSTRASTCSPRTWTCACRARAAGIPTILHPDLALTHTGRHSVESEPFDSSPAAAAP